MVWKSYKFWLVTVTVAALIGVIIAVGKLLHFWTVMPEEPAVLKYDASRHMEMNVLHNNSQYTSYMSKSPVDLITSKDQVYKLVWKTDEKNNNFAVIVDPSNKEVFRLQDSFHPSYDAYIVHYVQAENPSFKIWIIESAAGSGHYNYGFWFLAEINGKPELVMDKKHIMDILQKNPDEATFFKVDVMGNSLNIFTGNKAFVGRERSYDGSNYFVTFYKMVPVKFNRETGKFEVKEPVELDDSKD